MKTENQIRKKITEVKEALAISKNNYDIVAWKSSLNALEWVLYNE